MICTRRREVSGDSMVGSTSRPDAYLANDSTKPVSDVCTGHDARHSQHRIPSLDTHRACENGNEAQEEWSMQIETYTNARCHNGYSCRRWPRRRRSGCMSATSSVAFRHCALCKALFIHNISYLINRSDSADHIVSLHRQDQTADRFGPTHRLCNSATSLIARIPPHMARR